MHTDLPGQNQFQETRRALAQANATDHISVNGINSTIRIIGHNALALGQILSFRKNFRTSLSPLVVFAH